MELNREKDDLDRTGLYNRSDKKIEKKLRRKRWRGKMRLTTKEKKKDSLLNLFCTSMQGISPIIYKKKMKSG